MRERTKIEEEAKDLKFPKGRSLILEVLLDIRELLANRERREALKQLRDK